jgi:dihydroflavonol-4-reductase
MGGVAWVSGAAGFLGRHLLEQLVQDGWAVHVLLRGATPPWMDELGARVTHGALEDAAALRASMPAGVDAVFHLAGNISSWSGDRAALERDNVVATRNLLQVAPATGARRVVMTSTLGLFRAQRRRIDESAALVAAHDPNPYLATKRVADDLLTAAGQGGLSVVSLHPGHILGRYDRSGWITLFDQGARGQLGPAPGGSASFCAVREVARAHVAAARIAAPARRYVLGGADARYLELFARIAALVHAKPVTATAPGFAIRTIARLAQWSSAWTGKPPTITPGLAALLVRDMLADDSRAQAQLGYRPQPLEVMLAEAQAWWSARDESSGGSPRRA